MLFFPTMSIIYIHSGGAKDPYLRASFSLMHRMRRLLWRVVWIAFCRPSPVFFHGWRCYVLQCFGAQLGKNNLIYPSAQVWAPWLLETGDVVTIASGVEIYNPAGVLLGHHAIISQNSYLCGGSHDYNDPSFPMISRKIVVGSYAWVCARATVLLGVNIGEGAILGAAAVATRDLEPFGVYSGNPARLVSMRKRQLVR